MPTEQEAGGTATPLLDAARAAAERLAAEAAATERDRRVTDASVAAARAAGAFALGVRRSDGGIDADLTTRVRFLGELGRGCPSTAWIAATTSEGKRLLQVGVSGEAYADAFGDVDATPPGEALAAGERARLRMDLITAVRECRSALEDLLDLHGSGGLHSSNPLQRHWRDFAVGSRHVQFTSHVVEEDYGVLLLGVDDAPSAML
jgi:alkylation response protein AidB-like acyl-CoA dehydrogenase